MNKQTDGRKEGRWYILSSIHSNYDKIKNRKRNDHVANSKKKFKGDGNGNLG